MAWKRVKRQEEEKFHGRKISRDTVTGVTSFILQQLMKRIRVGIEVFD